MNEFTLPSRASFGHTEQHLWTRQPVIAELDFACWVEGSSLPKKVRSNIFLCTSTAKSVPLSFQNARPPHQSTFSLSPGGLETVRSAFRLRKMEKSFPSSVASITLPILLGLNLRSFRRLSQIVYFYQLPGMSGSCDDILMMVPKGGWEILPRNPRINVGDGALNALIMGRIDIKNVAPKLFIFNPRCYSESRG